MRIELLVVLLLSGSVLLSTARAEPASPKLIIADYFPHHRSREYDGHVGTWLQNRTAKLSKAKKTHFTWNADLIEENGRNQLAAPAYPMTGMQSDLDPEYQEFQILSAKVAHIDGFAVEWALPGDISSDNYIRSVSKVAKKYGFMIGVDWIEGSHFSWIQSFRKDATDRPGKLKTYHEALQYLVRDVYAGDVGLRLGKRPLIFLFGGFDAPTPKEFEDILAKPLNIPGNIERPWFIKRAGVGTKPEHAEGYYKHWRKVMDGMFGWVAVSAPRTSTPMPEKFKDHFDHFIDRHHAISYQIAVREMNQKYFRKGALKYRVNSAFPGFDNRGCAGWSRTLAIMEREAGEVYRVQWEHHVKYRDQIDAVMLVTWNDYTEGSVVEPTLEHGFRELETTEKYGAAFKGIASDPAGIRLPWRLFQLRKRRRFLARTGFDVKFSIAAMDRVGLQIASRKFAETDAALAKLEARFAAMGRRIKQKKISPRVGDGVKVVRRETSADGAYAVTGIRPLLLAVEEKIAKPLRAVNFDGVLTFEYLDEGRGFFVVNQSPARPDVIRRPSTSERYSEVCLIHKTDTGKWLPAKVRIHKVNAALDHKRRGADFLFRGKVSVRNVAFEFTAYRKR